MGCTHIGIPEWGLFSCVETNLAKLGGDQGPAEWLFVAGCYEVIVSGLPTKQTANARFTYSSAPNIYY